MAMTETRPAPAAEAVAPPVAVPADPPGIAGWLSTSDHKRVGRLYVATSLLFLLVATVVGAVVAIEGTQSGLDVFDDATSFTQAVRLYPEALVLLAALPLLIGIATTIVPLQVGSPEIAFPRGSATAYWLYLVSGAVLIGSYLADGGPTGGSREAADLWALALVGVLLAHTIALVSLLTTVLAMRASGMTLLRAPAFTFSVLVGGSLLLLTLPVLAARLVTMYVSHHFGADFTGYEGVRWAWSIPSLYLLAVIPAGVALEVVPVLARNRVRAHGATLAVLGLLGVVGVGAWAQRPETFDDLLYVAIGLAAVLPALALLGLLGDTLRAGKPKVASPLGFAVGTVLLLLLGAVAGALLSIEPLELHGTTWESGVFHLVVGAALLGGIGGLFWWASKVHGAVLPEGAGFLSFLAVLGGSVLRAAGDLVNGMANDLPLDAREFDTDGGVEALNALAAAGNVLLAVGALLAVLGVLAALRRRTGVADDPWGGHTLEWATTSPPAAGNFAGPLVPVTSPTPLLADEVNA